MLKTVFTGFCSSPFADCEVNTNFPQRLLAVVSYYFVQIYLCNNYAENKVKKKIYYVWRFAISFLEHTLKSIFQVDGSVYRIDAFVNLKHRL